MRTTKDIIYILCEFANDFPEMYVPDISENYKNSVAEAIQEAVDLLRTHAVEPQEGAGK